MIFEVEAYCLKVKRRRDTVVSGDRECSYLFYSPGCMCEQQQLVVIFALLCVKTMARKKGEQMETCLAVQRDARLEQWRD